MKKILSSLLIVALVVTVMVPMSAGTQTSTPLTVEQATIIGGDLSNCVNAGIWGFGTILLSGTVLFGGIAAGIAISYLVDCVAK